MLDNLCGSKLIALEAMDTCFAGKKNFTFESMFQGHEIQESVSQPESAEEIVPFPPCMISALRAKLQGTGVLYINGPIGSGKRILLKQAASIPIYDFWDDDLGRMLQEKDLRAIRQKIQRPLGGEDCIWMFYPAALLSDALVNAMAKTKWQTRVVLIGDEKIQGLGQNFIHYHQISPRFFQHVARTLGRTSNMDHCGNDLRMLQHGAASQSDKTPHVYFDTKAILNGDERPKNPEFYSQQWLEENVLNSSLDLEACADFYKTLSDTNSYDTYDTNDTEADILALSLPKYKRAPNKLAPPTQVQRKSECPYTYFQHRKKGKLAYALHVQHKQYEDAMRPRPEALGKVSAQAVAPSPKRSSSNMETHGNTALDTHDDVVAPEEPAPEAKRARVVAPEEPAPEAKRARVDTPSHSSTDKSDPELQFCPTPEYEFNKTRLLYKSNLRTNVRSQTEASNYSLIQSMVRDPPATLKQIHWIIAEYGLTDSRVVAEALATLDDSILFDIVHVEGRCAVLIYKPGFRNLHFTLGVLKPTLYVANLPFRAGQQKAKEAQFKLVSTFQDLPGEHVGNMYLHRAGTSDDEDVAMLLDFCKDMSNEQYNEFVLKANVKRENGSPMTAAENYISHRQIEPRVREFRKLTSGKSEMVIRLSDPNILGLVKKPQAFHEKCKHWPVTIHDTSKLTIEIPRLGNATNVVSMETFFQYPELHQELSLIIPGERRKGKTEYAKLKALELAYIYVPDDPYFIFATTLDSLKSVQAYMNQECQ